MHDQFMIQDIIRTSECVLLFTLIVLVPGYVLGWLLDLLNFRRLTLPVRLAVAVPMSIGICPITTYFLWRFSGPSVWVFYGACAAMFLALTFRERRTLFSRSATNSFWKTGMVPFALVSVWAIAAILALVDLQIGRRLYFPSVTYDYALRSAFTAAIGRTGVPPANPSFSAGHTFSLRYHYFWLILCSVVQKLAGFGVSPRQAMIAGTVWCGIGLAAIACLYCRFFYRDSKPDNRRALLAVLLLGVTGLDILPVVFIELLARRFIGSLEWWNDPVMGWVHAVLWVPHHVACLIACLTGFLLVWDARSSQGTRTPIIAAIVAGGMFASAAGLSIYVTLVFAVFVFVWMSSALLRGDRKHAGCLCVSGLTALLLTALHALELVRGSTGSGTSSAILQLAVKPFTFVDILFGISQGRHMTLVNLVLLPVNYVFELGFFAIAGVVQGAAMWRRRNSLNEVELCSLTMLTVSIVVCSFVRSSVISNNDLGWRGTMLAQFVLLMWGAELLSNGLVSSMKHRRSLVLAALVLGVAGTTYELVKVRSLALASDMGFTTRMGWLSEDRNLGARTYALRQLYEDLKTRTPAVAVFQHNPDSEPQDSFHGLYADRQLVAEGATCGVVFGGDSRLCSQVIGDINSLFTNPKRFEESQIDTVCGSLSIDLLVVKDTDPVWQDRASWVWKRKPFLANDYGRAFKCGPAAASEQVRNEGPSAGVSARSPLAAAGPHRQ